MLQSLKFQLYEATGRSQATTRFRGYSLLKLGNMRSELFQSVILELIY